MSSHKYNNGLLDMMSSPSVSVSVIYVTLFNQYLDDLNQKPDAAASSSCRTQAVRSEEHWLPLSDITRLMRRVSQCVGNDGYGLEVGKYIHPSDYSIAGYTLMNCQNLGQALEFAVCHKGLLNQGFSASLSERSDKLHYQLDSWINQKTLAPLIELDFASAAQFARLLAGPRHQEQVTFERVLFKHQPLSEKHDYDEIFQCPVLFGQARNCLVISRPVLEIPVHGANPQLFRMLHKKLLTLKKTLEDSQSLSEQVLHYLHQHLGPDLPDSNRCAQHFHMSISAFKKRLHAENNNYQFICDQIRYQHATKLVCQNRQSIKEISFQLGFANPSAFNRAFKRWTQMNPAEYRKQSYHQMAHSASYLSATY